MTELGAEEAAFFLKEQIYRYENLLKLSKQQKKVMEAEEATPVLDEIIHLKECVVNDLRKHDETMKAVQEANRREKGQSLTLLTTQLRQTIEAILEIEGVCKGLVEKRQDKVKESIRKISTGKKIAKGYDQTSQNKRGFLSIKR